MQVQVQVTDTFTMDVKKMLVSDKVSGNNRKNWQYIAGYQVDGETIILLLIKTPNNIFSCGISQYDKNSAYVMSFNISERPGSVVHCQNIWTKVELQLFEKKNDSV